MLCLEDDVLLLASKASGPAHAVSMCSSFSSLSTPSANPASSASSTFCSHPVFHVQNEDGEVHHFLKICAGQPSTVLARPSSYTLLISILYTCTNMITFTLFSFILSARRLINNCNWLNTMSIARWLYSLFLKRINLLFYCISLFCGLRHEGKKAEAISESWMSNLRLSTSCVVLECVSFFTWCSTIFQTESEMP